MNTSAYFDSLTEELRSMKNRIRHFIGDAHWQTDGEWKETVLRSILRRYLPRTVDVGKGFIITKDGPSTQIDVLIYDTTKPILFRDGDFVLVTPDATLGVIEVKTQVRNSELKTILNIIYQIAKLHRRQPTTSMPFYGLFSYEDSQQEPTAILQVIKETFYGFAVTPIHILSFGESKFVRFWECDPHDSRKPIHSWHAYNIEGKAPAYFLHNAIGYACHQSVCENDDLWFPREGKEVHLVASITMNREQTSGG